MLTMKTKYALKALAQLAAGAEGEPLLIAEIAEREDIPLKFLQLILRELKQHGILRSRKGRGGGYLLARAPESVSLATVIRVLDGPTAPVPCLSKTAYHRCEGCRDETTCGIRLVLRDVHEATLRVLEHTTVADLARLSRLAGSKQPLQLRYSI
jgi:Rrf2 family protein